MKFIKPKCPHCDTIVPLKKYWYRHQGSEVTCPQCGKLSTVDVERWWLRYLGMSIVLFFSILMHDLIKTEPWWIDFLFFAVILSILSIPIYIFIWPMTTRLL